MRGDSESASKNTYNCIIEHPNYSNARIFENSLARKLIFVDIDIDKDDMMKMKWCSVIIMNFCLLDKIYSMTSITETSINLKLS